LADRLIHLRYRTADIIDLQKILDMALADRANADDQDM
jgi:hypothetical protein